MTKTEIETKIAELKDQRDHLGPFPTEIYTRIVGYYRSLANWNAGKREEYRHRVTFAEDATRVQTALDRAAQRQMTKAASYLLFTQASCPNCPAMKARVSTLSLAGRDLDVRAETGYQAAIDWNVTATPTLVLLDADGRELDRIMSAVDWPQIEGFLVAK